MTALARKIDDTAVNDDDDELWRLARDGRRPALDLLAQAIGRARPLLLTGTTKQRFHLLWAAVKTARDLGASDVVHDAFMALAVEVGMIDARNISHVIVWAQRG